MNELNRLLLVMKDKQALYDAV